MIVRTAQPAPWNNQVHASLISTVPPGNCLQVHISDHHSGEIPCQSGDDSSDGQKEGQTLGVGHLLQILRVFIYSKTSLDRPFMLYG